MNTDTQDRGQWTSASAAERDGLCPGSHLACLGLPEPEPQEVTVEGRKVHAWLHWKRTSSTDPEPECNYELAERCWRIEERAVGSWITRLPESAADFPTIVISERRMWVSLWESTIKASHSGQMDALYIKGPFAKIVDTKSGWLEAVPPNRNEQLRDLAALVSANFSEVFEVEVEIAQPGADKQPPCVYKRHELAGATLLMYKRVVESHNPQAKRIPGEVQCRYCRAKGTTRCPESTASVKAVVNFAPLPVTEVPSPQLLDACLLAEKIIEVVKQRAKAALKADPNAIPGFYLEPNSPNRPITDPQTCWVRAAEKGLTLEQFLSCVKVGKGDLEEALKQMIRAKTGKKRVEGFVPVWQQLLDGITTEEPKEPSIKRRLG